MASFLTGLMSVGKAIGGAAKTWGEGTKAAKDLNNLRQSKMNPWYKAKNQPGSKNEGDTSTPDVSVGQDA